MELEEWEHLPENGVQESHFNPTGVFEVNYFTSPTAPNPVVEKKPGDAIVKEVVREEAIVPPVAIAGSDVIFQLVFEQMKESTHAAEEDGISSDSEGSDITVSYCANYVEEDEVGNEKSSSSAALIGRKKWMSRGLGVLCSIGMAAATLAILLGGNQQQFQSGGINTKRTGMGVQKSGADIKFGVN
ncbi:uncharacterized protein [Typha latifolia]|uniref:uncharacterized protein n=1 Tax=Typha latifolia TaxID=4733 RepID=UPI003C2C5A92